MSQLDTVPSTEETFPIQSIVLTVSGSDAVASSPEGDDPYNILVTFSADSGNEELLQDVLQELQQLSSQQSEQIDQLLIQNELLDEEIKQTQNSGFVNVMFLGLIAGMLLMLGLWRIK